MSCARATGLGRLSTVLRLRKTRQAPDAPDAEAPDDIITQHALSYGAAPDLVADETRIEIARQKSLRRTLP